MKLKLRRSQKSSMFRGAAIFQLQAIADVSSEERGLISKYGLGKEVVYASESYQNNVAKAAEGRGFLRTVGAIAMASLNLKITIETLIAGTQIECKSLEEMLGTEEAIISACQNLRAYLETALTFDGREVVIDI